MIYGDVFERLEAEGVRYVVVGGVAVVLHGHERRVNDLDIVVDPAPAEARRAQAALMSLGFFPTLPLPLEMLTVLTMMDGAGRSVDVFARFRICDDGLGTITVVERDNKARALASQRRFRITRTTSCATFSRSWLPAPRFRTKGRYVVTLRAADTSNALSRIVSRSLIKR